MRSQERPVRRSRRDLRDRHGRGMRGPLVPRGVPLQRSRAQQFDEYVLDAVERLERRFPDEMRQLEFAVEDVPPAAASGAEWRDGEVPLAHLFPAGRGRRPRIVLYRRPIEVRTPRGELPDLVHDVVVEEVAHVLGRSPEDIDPTYGEG